jgi:LuxR family maltose regulon positive regulatory protein
MVTRDRLLEILDDAAPAVVSLVAPPGYGKTTLLSQWVARQDRPVAWLTVDITENDPVVLMACLATAFDRVSPIGAETARAVSGSSRKILSAGLPLLVSELHSWRQPGLIVLDDAHLLTDQSSLDAISTLIDHLPSGFRIAIASRYQPRLPFARLAASRDLLELGVDELALDAAETGELVRTVGCELTIDDIAVLTERTEGWAAGVYLATRALNRSGGGLAHVASFKGTDGHVAAYIRSELEDGLGDDDLIFLTRTSVLGRVSPAVAEAITGLPDAGGRLRELTKRSLLIQELAAEEPTYRYHNLLRELLAQELETREPGSSALMHRRASSWYHAAGEVDLAIEHALAGEDHHTAARYITAAAYAAHQHGRTATLDRWLSFLDVEAITRHPPLAVIAAWVYLLTGRGDEADAMADVAERATYHGSPGDGSASFASQRAMLRAMMNRSGAADALAQAKIALALERPGSTWRSTALLMAGSAYEMLGDVDSADLAYIEAIGTGASGSWSTVMSAFAKRAQLRLNAGDWAGAEDLIERAEELRELWGFDDFVAVLFVHAISARIAIQRGDFDRGRESLVRAQLVRPLANHAAAWLSVDALLNLCRAYLAVSDPAGAQLALREAETIVRRRPSLGTLSAQLVEVRAHLADATATLIGSSALTSAELRVLPFLPTYLSFQEIAERLMISRNTVKTHAMSIYGKLWASSRGEAVERAVEMGLLEPYPALTRGAALAANGVPRLRLIRHDEIDEIGDEAG